jgi:YVTN family beta-propeller protein
MMSIIDGGDNTVVDEIFVGCSPRDISVNEYTNHIYVANSPCGSISMIDGDTNEVEGVIALGSDPMSLDVSKTLDRVYVTDYFNNSLYVVDGFANSIITTIPVGSRPSGSGVKVNNLNDFIYVVNNTEGNVYVVDAKTNEVIDSIALAEENDGTEVAPGGIDINPQTNRIYVPYGDPGYVAVIACQFLISIDIKPGSYPNSINLKSRGKVPVAILTTDDFDAQYVDPETCVFAGAEPLRWNMIDLGRDGDVDMILHFKTQELNLNQNSTEASLVCEIYGGTQIKGTDSVSIVPKNKVGSKNLKK